MVYITLAYILTGIIEFYHGVYHTRTHPKGYNRVLSPQAENAQNYLNNLSEYAPIFAALNTPEDGLWNNSENYC
jgi:hypothetical protein